MTDGEQRRSSKSEVNLLSARRPRRPGASANGEDEKRTQDAKMRGTRTETDSGSDASALRLVASVRRPRATERHGGPRRTTEDHGGPWGATEHHGGPRRTTERHGGPPSTTAPGNGTRASPRTCRPRRAPRTRRTGTKSRRRHGRREMLPRFPKNPKRRPAAHSGTCCGYSPQK